MKKASSSKRPAALRAGKSPKLNHAQAGQIPIDGTVLKAIRTIAAHCRVSEAKVLNDGLRAAYDGMVKAVPTVGNWLEQMPGGNGPVEVRIHLKRDDLAVVLAYMVNQNASFNAVITHALNRGGFFEDVFNDEPIEGLWNTAGGAQ